MALSPKKKVTWIAKVEQYSHDKSMIGQTVALQAAMLPGNTSVNITASRFNVKKQTTNEVLAQWEVRYCRKYGLKTPTLFCIDAGRRCAAGPGSYHFQIKKSEGLMSTLDNLLDEVNSKSGDKGVLQRGGGMRGTPPVANPTTPGQRPTPVPSPVVVITESTLLYTNVSIGNEVTEAAQTTAAPSVTTYIDIDLTKTKALQGAKNNTKRFQDVRALERACGDNGTTSVAELSMDTVNQQPKPSSKLEPVSRYININNIGAVAKHTVDDELDNLMNEVDSELTNLEPPTPTVVPYGRQTDSLSSAGNPSYININLLVQNRK